MPLGLTKGKALRRICARILETGDEASVEILRGRKSQGVIFVAVEGAASEAFQAGESVGEGSSRSNNTLEGVGSEAGIKEIARLRTRRAAEGSYEISAI